MVEIIETQSTQWVAIRHIFEVVSFIVSLPKTSLFRLDKGIYQKLGSFRKKCIVRSCDFLKIRLK